MNGLFNIKHMVLLTALLALTACGGGAGEGAGGAPSGGGPAPTGLRASGTGGFYQVPVDLGAGTTVGPTTGFTGMNGFAYDPNTDTLYGVDVSTNQLLSINPATGASTVVGDLGSINGLTNRVIALAFDPNSNILYGVNFGNQLIKINTNTLEVKETFYSLGFDFVFGLAVDPINNVLYGVAANIEPFLPGKLITINMFTGVGTAVGMGNLGFTSVSSLAYDPITANLYGADIATDQLIVINKSNGAGTAVGALGYGNLLGLAFDSNSNTLYGTDDDTDELLTIAITTQVADAATLSFADVEGLAYDPNSNTLYGVDNTTDQLLTINPTTGAGTAVGALGFANVNSLAFDPNTNTLYGVDATGTVGGDLITINPATGTGTAVGSLGLLWGTISGLTFDPGSSTLYGVDNGVYDQLLRIDTISGIATAIGALRSLQSSGFDDVEGLAFDPGTNTLYGTDTTTNQLITINPINSVGTAVGVTDVPSHNDALLTGLAYLY